MLYLGSEEAVETVVARVGAELVPRRWDLRRTMADEPRSGAICEISRPAVA